MTDSTTLSDDDLVARMSKGDERAMMELLDRHRPRLRRMVQLRMNQQLQGRIDASDVVQDAYVDVSRLLADYLSDPNMPFFLWLRHITQERLIDAHRKHLGAQKRDARLEVAIPKDNGSMVDSASLARHLLGGLTSPSHAAVRAEMQARVHDALNELDSVDREILALRHFEQMNNAETAATLNMNRSTASTRYLRALKRIRDLLADFPELNL